MALDSIGRPYVQTHKATDLGLGNFNPEFASLGWVPITPGMAIGVSTPKTRGVLHCEVQEGMLRPRWQRQDSSRLIPQSKIQTPRTVSASLYLEKNSVTAKQAGSQHLILAVDQNGIQSQKTGAAYILGVGVEGEDHWPYFICQGESVTFAGRTVTGQQHSRNYLDLGGGDEITFSKLPGMMLRMVTMFIYHDEKRVEARYELRLTPPGGCWGLSGDSQLKVVWGRNRASP